MIINSGKFSPFIFVCISAFIWACHANVAPLDPSTIKLVFEDHTPTLFIVSPSSGKADPETLYKLHSTAQKYYQLHPEKSPETSNSPAQRLLFVLSDPNDGLYTYDRLTQFLGLKQKNIQIIYLGGDGRKFRYGYNGKNMEPTQISIEGVLKFLQQVENNELPVYYKSEDQNQIVRNKNKYVTRISGNKFRQYVHATTEQLFILFYAPLCYKSRVLKGQFQKAAQSLQKNKNIKFVQIDLQKNQIPIPISASPSNPKQVLTQKQAPVLYLLKSDKNKDAVEYKIMEEYENTYDYMLKWLKQRTEYEWVRSVDVSQQIEEEL